MSAFLEAHELAVDLISGDLARAARRLGVKPNNRSLTRIWNVARPWLSSPKLRGIGIGWRVKAGRRRRDALVVKILVDTKVDERRLVAPVPRTVRVPDFGELETDVEPIGTPSTHACPTVLRPALCGSSVGHMDGGVGTLGCLVRKSAQPDRLYLLSAGHVLAPHGAAVGDPIYQPAAAECRPPRSPIARLSTWTPLGRGSSYPNAVDGAIAELTKSNSVTRELLELGIVPTTTVTVDLDDLVEKVGCGSLRSSGRVTAVHASVSLRHLGSPGQPMLGFRRQMVCTPMSVGGDSGAVVLDGQHRLVGMIIGGGPRISVVTPISAVFAEFGVRLA